MGWCIVTGAWQGDLYVSLRAMPDRAHAGEVLGRVLRKLGRAGGHGTMAGGKVPLKSAGTGRAGAPGEGDRPAARPRPAAPDRVTLRPLIGPDELDGAFNSR